MKSDFQVWLILDAILVCEGFTCSVLSRAVAADTREALNCVWEKHGG